MILQSKKKFLAVSTLALPVIALIVFFFGSPQAVSAHATCSYAGQDYSEGAQSQNGCPAGQSQVCQANGTWSACGS
jgi:hypothetical protein